jgi:HSP20 family protein
MKSLMKRSSDFFPAVPSLIDEFFNRNWLDSTLGTGRTVPAANISENDEEILIELAAPGMRRDDFKIEVDNAQLTISCERDESSEHQRGRSTRREFSYQSFERTFALPSAEVKRDKIQAKYVDGILRVSVPKTEEAKKKAARQIQVA